MYILVQGSLSAAVDRFDLPEVRLFLLLAGVEDPYGKCGFSGNNGI
jgi:hypothetical protein